MSERESALDLISDVAHEFAERLRRGERPTIDEYVQRYPDFAVQIRELFPALAMMEQFGSVAGPSADSNAARGAAPQQLGDYRILREIGRGGMGVVYEAVQESLGRHVAVKVLPMHAAGDGKQLERFRREAKAAAQLHHSNIVPVFAVGEHEGTPYYAMQFIQGQGLELVLQEVRRMRATHPAPAAEQAPAATPLTATLAHRLLDGDAAPCSTLTGDGTGPRGEDTSDGGHASDPRSVLPAQTEGQYFRSVAGIGVQVAQALAYAHQQGMFHRDIKPSNLLLDARGTVWVTDFGLVKAEGSGELTATGDIIGTIRYMAPERFEGRCDARSDVYALGVTLYELLALQPAFAESDRNKLIHQVTQSGPARLRSVHESVPRDLETIVHKAIEHDPAHRYASAQELADDLQRFLADEPIRARRISLRERWWRWCRRNPVVAGLSTGLAVALALLTVASLLAAGYFNDLAHEQAQAAALEREARQASDEAKEREAALRAQADEERRRAEANFAKARKAVDDYFTSVSESQLLRVPGMQPLRRELLQSALGFYQDFLAERFDDPAIRGELAAAYLRVATIYLELNDQADARKACEQARALYASLLRAAPAAIEWQHGLALAWYRLGQPDEAIALWQKLVQPGQPSYQNELAQAYNARAANHLNANRNAEAMQDHRQALAIREMLAQLDPDDPALRYGLGQTLNNIGVLLARAGKPAEALAMYERAAENGEVAFALAAQVIDYGRGVALFHRNVAHIEVRSPQRSAKAMFAYRRVVEIARKLARDNPAVPGLHSDLFRAYRELATFQRRYGQGEDADRTMRLARDVIDRLPSDGADDLFNLACVRALCAGFIGPGTERAVDDEAERAREIEQALTALQRAVAAGFRDLARLRGAGELNALRGRKEFKLLEADLAARVAGDTDKLRAGQLKLALRQKLADADPGNKRLQADLAASQHALGALQVGYGKSDEALKSYTQALAVRKRLVQEDPDNATYMADLCATVLALGELYWESGRLAEGATCWDQFLEQANAALRRQPADVTLKQVLADGEGDIANAYAALGLWNKAATMFARAFSHGSPQRRNMARNHCWAIRTHALLLTGDDAEYERHCDTVMKLFGPKSDTPDPWQVGYVWSLSPHAVRGSNWATLINRAVSAGRYGVPSDRFVVDLARYRNQQWQEALAGLEAAERYNGAKCWVMYAMIHHQLGHPKEARQWLAKAERWYAETCMKMVNDAPMEYPASPWWEWAQFQVLRREAAAMIEGKAASNHPLLMLHRGRCYVRLGDTKQAEVEFAAAVDARPNDPAVRVARARVFARLGWHERAEADFAKAIALDAKDPEAWLARGRWLAGRGSHEAADADVIKAIELKQAKIPLPEQGRAHATLGEWRWAMTCYARAGKSPRDQQGGVGFEHACLCLLTDDKAGYRRTLAALMDPSPDALRFLIARTCALSPETATELPRAAELSAREVDGNQKYYLLTVAASLHYRAGRFQIADKLLRQCVQQNPTWDGKVVAWLWLAMTSERLGQKSEARQWLNQAEQWLGKYQGGMPTRPEGTIGIHLHDWLEAHVLLREAQRLIPRGEP
jgi:serine/threonine-protein kinase